MAIQFKEIIKINQIIDRIQLGRFDANDVDNLLVKLRPYAGDKKVFLEIAHFVAHPDARDRGLAQQSILAFTDHIQYLREYVFPKRLLDIEKPFPSYIYRLFLSQVRYSDERELKRTYRVSHRTLIKKIEASFVVDKKAGTCVLRPQKSGVEFVNALSYIMGFLYSRPAFHLNDFHKELKELMIFQKLTFDIVAWDAQQDRISLAILCLVSNTDFVLENGGSAKCVLASENNSRIFFDKNGHPEKAAIQEPESFGKLMIVCVATTGGIHTSPKVSFPIIDTDLQSQDHCDDSLFRKEKIDGQGDGYIERIDFAPDMSLTNEFKIVRADALVK